ncbi:Era-like protein [Volvox carteri f. nagariensis]|uniref:Era-like protein n=1 Tax=Volvox carteri f. nagariensis TaxID=3068 RepID=D8U1L9_VOLCA|nr:Era-like protein [Volvox carteri f. nagariensis]EFJ46362.1 Era-like protein [Volvox carteri f. nagariensis]|eukprot:XP_002952515.1 Era-like protein [Volvox carteri f. nagariensis]
MQLSFELYSGGFLRPSAKLPPSLCPRRTAQLMLERSVLCARCAPDVAEPQPEASASNSIHSGELRTRRRLVRPRTTVKNPKWPAEPESNVAAAGQAELEPKRSRRSAVASASKSTKSEQLVQEKEAFGPTILNESSPFYQPALTDEDLEQDPPGHRSGYVAVIGKPNAGKSTLINALVGQKLSIVTYKPQTTRHRIMGIASDKHYQMILFDTPGVIERKRTKLEERMMAAVVHSIKDSEAIVAVVDSADKPKEALAMFQPGESWNGPPMAVLLNKADLLTEDEIQELKTWYTENCRAEQVFVGSAERRDGLEALREWAVSRLPEGPTLYSKKIVSEQPERFFVAECIREQVFLHCQQEVPYCSQVLIKEFTERRGGLKDFISAEIVVEKESQKGILIGAGGAMLRRIGQEARREIETFLERGVYLELSVQVDKDWRDDKEALNKYGYFNPMMI